MIKKVLIYLFLILLISCSPQQRIARIAEKYNLVQTKIITVNDTIVTPEFVHTFVTVYDSTGNFEYIDKQTGMIVQGSVKDSLIYVTVTVPADTVIKTIDVPYKDITVNEVEWKKSFEEILFYVFIGSFLVVIALWLKRKYLSR